MESELFDICCERDPKPADQRRRIIKALKMGADIHATDKNGVTALHHAVRFRSPTAVKVLIEHGENVNQVKKTSTLEFEHNGSAFVLREAANDAMEQSRG